MVVAQVANGQDPQAGRKSLSERGNETTQKGLILMDTNDFLKRTKCRGCYYEDTCAGITKAEVRERCTEFSNEEPSEKSVSSWWTEMSYYHVDLHTGRSQQERLREEYEPEWTK